MADESGTARARNYREATDKEKEHFAKHHIKLGFAGDEVVIGYGIACDCETKGEEKCTFPHTTVTVRMCPKAPC